MTEPEKGGAKSANAPEVEPGGGIRGMKTSNAFRILNFELYAKPNKRVMGLGGFVFLAACGYILYLRMTDEFKNTPTYNSMNEDGSLTRRIKKSKWD